MKLTLPNYKKLTLPNNMKVIRDYETYIIPRELLFDLTFMKIFSIVEIKILISWENILWFNCPMG